MKKLFSLTVLLVFGLAPTRAEAGSPSRSLEALEKIARAIENLEKIKTGLEHLTRWVGELLRGKEPRDSLRCRQPDETIRTVTRQIQELKVPPLLDPKKAPYRSAVTNGSPQKLWKQDADKLIAYNRELRKQLRETTQVGIELDRVIREGKYIRTAAEVVASAHKRLEIKIQAAKQLEGMMKDSFGCAWKDLERGLLFTMKELLTQAERKKRAFSAARATQERALKEHTDFLLAGFRKHGLSVPSEIR